MTTYYISPLGNDDWSGTQPDVTAGDGPFATLERAQKAAREIGIKPLPLDQIGPYSDRFRRTD